MKEAVVESCLCLGGHGYPIAPGDAANLVFSDRSLAIRIPNENSFDIPYLELATLNITGPGATTTGGGLVGGGFGVESAVAGMAIAAILNRLSTKSTIHTFLLITTNVGELHFHYSGMEPTALRIALAGPFTALRRLDPNWQRERHALLEMHRTYTGLSDGEFERLKDRLIHTPRPSASDAPVRANRLNMGGCPNCASDVPLNALECPTCKATFGPGSSWQIVRR